MWIRITSVLLLTMAALIVHATPTPILSFNVDPTGTLIRQDADTNNDGPHLGPTVIDLAASGLVAGHNLTIAQNGNAFFSSDGNATFPSAEETVGSLHAVFATTSDVLIGDDAETTINRVVNPLPLSGAQANFPIVTDPTFTGGQPTDIAEDFFVFRQGAIFGGSVFQGSYATVPDDAKFLLIGFLDSFAEDNFTDSTNPLRVDLFSGFLPITQVPAPAPLALIALTLLGFAARRRRTA